ncbi:acid-sensing ion channel 2-like [Lingula anatina]|uniref:Acid-sensing ion channel 2-like n=1 Tax=Lingula anatina TaxID=7574 RepID=A0A1S3HDI2_LINAN|nr:acid-sensing ion channel 2-like [Lingula anatina]|eukprot:XP_013384102.1 acid-sensing ion channel 2-like [Lingula anatina]
MTSTRNEKEDKAKEEPHVSIETFATSTSAHGFARAYQSRHLVAKAIWTALITAGFIVAVVQIYFRFAAYFRYDTTTKITMVFAKELQFPADFTHAFTSFGNCYTFNANGSKYQDQEGIGNGLHLEINIQQYLYSNSLLRGDDLDAGIFFHVHNQSEPPSIETKGRAAAPGFRTYAGLSRLDTDTLEPPYGPCNQSASLQYYEVYTTSGCIMECKLNHILEACGCKPMQYPGDARECSLVEETKCVLPVLANIRQNFTRMCKCPVPCQVVTYQTSVTSTAVPSLSTGGELKDIYNVDVTSYKKNFVILDVYLESLNYVHSEQQPAIEPGALIGDIGGQFGLFMGFSLLTIVEFIEFAILTVFAFVCYPKTKPKVDVAVEDAHEKEKNDNNKNRSVDYKVFFR